MVRFDFLERHGVFAAMSDAGDGDCALADAGEASLTHRARLLAAHGFDPGRAVAAQQVHGVFVAEATATDAGNGRTRAHAFPATDGILTSECNLPLTITVADCVPLFVLDPSARLGAVVHAGRVGTQHKIAGAAVRALLQRGATARNLVALIGPSAGPCCYEVGAAMAHELAALGMYVRGRYIDLWESNRAALRAEGVPDEQIAVDGRCTICQPGFFSHRRDADGRRNMAVLALHRT